MRLADWFRRQLAPVEDESFEAHLTDLREQVADMKRQLETVERALAAHVARGVVEEAKESGVKWDKYLTLPDEVLTADLGTLQLAVDRPQLEDVKRVASGPPSDPFGFRRGGKRTMRRDGT